MEEGKFVRIRSDEGEWVAAGTASYIDAFVEHCAAVLDVPPPNERFDYVWMPEGVEASPCGSELFAGCTNGTTVFTPFLPHKHELVHVVTAALPRPDSFIEEGVAEAVASAQRPLENLHLARQMLGADRSAPVDYAVAGRVMADVLAIYGPEALRELWHAAPRGTAGAEVLDAFEQITAVSFDRLVEEAFEDECVAPPMFECLAPRLEWTSGQIRLDADLTVTGPDTVGLEPALGGLLDEDGEPPGAFSVYRVLRVGAPLSYATSRGHRIHLRPCSCAQTPPQLVGYEGVLDLEPGDYALRFATGNRDTGPGWMRLSQASD